MTSGTQLVSVNVGAPREIHWKGKRTRTCIFKEPVSGTVAVHRLHLEGDRQADLRVHGGPNKAVYVYPAEHYNYWRAELPGQPLPLGMFGENLTTEGLREVEIAVGDRLRIGTAEFEVTSPRIPCYKLAAKFGRDDMIKRFLAARRPGFYLKVLQEGALRSGNPIELLDHNENRVTVADVARLYTSGPDNVGDLRRAAQVAHLLDNWPVRFRERIQKIEASG